MTDPDWEQFGDRKTASREIGSVLKKYRADAGITAYELAKRTGVARSMICKIEAGDRSPSIRTLSRLAPELGAGFVEDMVFAASAEA